MLMAFVISFLSQMIISLSIIKNTPLNDRLLSPVYIPMIIGFSWIFHQLFSYLNKKLPGLLHKAATLILICIFLFQPLKSYAELREIQTRPFSDNFFNSKYFKKNSITEYLSQIDMKPDQIWYSNCSRCTLVFAEKMTTIFDPYSDNKKGYLPDNNQAFYLVWYNNFYAEGINQKLDPITEIKKLGYSPLQIQKLHDFNDGQIYFIYSETGN